MPVYTEQYAKSVGYWLQANRPGELDFIDRYARQTGGPILELASGAARVTKELARRGHTVYGVEMSPSMLTRARDVLAAEAPELRDRVRMVRGDMTRFAFGRTFPIIVIPFYSFWHNLDEKGADACVRCMVSHLAPGGLFMVEGEREYADLNEERNAFWGRTSQQIGFRFRYEKYRLLETSEMPFNSFLIGWRP